MKTPHGIELCTRDGLFEHVVADLRERYEFTTDDCAAVTAYFETGDLDAYLAGGRGIGPYLLLFLAPQGTLEAVTLRFKSYWDWVLEDPEARRDRNDRAFDSLEEQLISPFGGLLDYRWGNFFSAELAASVFHWLYGETFQPDRRFPLPLGPQGWQPRLPVQIERLCTDLMLGLDEHLFGRSNDCYHDHARYALLICFFVSLLPSLDIECYSRDLVSRFHKIDGKKTGRRAHQFRTRKFLAHLNSVLSSGELDDGLETVPVNDPAALAELRRQLSAASLPREYFALEQSILEWGPDYQEG
ncbi:MAG: hypothetical protein AAF604_12075 [Acidobacteriota bacterium]